MKPATRNHVADDDDNFSYWVCEKLFETDDGSGRTMKTRETSSSSRSMSINRQGKKNRHKNVN